MQFCNKIKAKGLDTFRRKFFIYIQNTQMHGKVKNSTEKLIFLVKCLRTASFAESNMAYTMHPKEV